MQSRLLQVLVILVLALLLIIFLVIFALFHLFSFLVPVLLSCSYVLVFVVFMVLIVLLVLVLVLIIIILSLFLNPHSLFLPPIILSYCGDTCIDVAVVLVVCRAYLLKRHSFLIRRSQGHL